MKTKNLLFAFVVLLISQSIQAQTIDPSSEWRVDYYYAEPSYMHQSFYKDFIDGDTIINNLEYHKVYCSGYSYTEWIPPGYYTYFEHSLHGFLREENNKWYTFYEGFDTLLVDFTLNVGDTVFSAYTFVIEQPLVVIDIDSVTIDGEFRKRLYLNGDLVFGAEYIIEGIGASTGLFENMLFFEWGSELICFAKNGISLWGESAEECDLAVNINDNQENAGQFFVYPNPAKDFTMLNIPDGFGKVAVTIIDLVGGIVYQESFESPSTNKIKLNSYHSGIYLGIIESKGLRQTIKLIIE